MTADEPIEIVVDGVLDLHTFHPSDAKELVPDYLAECRRENILTVRIIHGKGSGVLMRIVHSRLEKLPYVESYCLADGTGGGWGATIVELSPAASY